MFWLGAAVSLCYVPGFTGAYIATQWPLLSVVLAFCVVWAYATTQWPSLADRFPFLGVRSGPFTVFHVVGLAFIAYAFALWPFSPAPYASVFGLWLLVIMGLSVWFGTTLASTKELYAGLAAGAGISSAVAVLQYFGVETVARVSVAPAGLYVNSVQMGAALSLIAVALVSEKMWFWLLAVAPGIMLSHSRGAWIILAVGVLGCFVRRSWVLGVMAAAGAFYWLMPLSSSDTQRMLIWKFAWEHLTWLGWGPGVFYAVILSQRSGTGVGEELFYPEYAHNDALQLAFEYGIGAALAFAVFAYAIYRTDTKEWPVVVAFCAAGCFSMPLFMPAVAFLALVAVGRVLRVHGLARSDGSSGGHSFVPKHRRGITGARRQAVSVAPHHSAKGGAAWQ